MYSSTCAVAIWWHRDLISKSRILWASDSCEHCCMPSRMPLRLMSDRDILAVFLIVVHLTQLPWGVVDNGHAEDERLLDV